MNIDLQFPKEIGFANQELKFQNFNLNLWVLNNS